MKLSDYAKQTGISYRTGGGGNKEI